MHARIDGRDIKLLTRTGLDWSHRYRRAIGSPLHLIVKATVKVHIHWPIRDQCVVSPGSGGFLRGADGSTGRVGQDFLDSANSVFCHVGILARLPLAIAAARPR
jgi:hypothetical protein